MNIRIRSNLGFPPDIRQKKHTKVATSLEKAKVEIPKTVQFYFEIMIESRRKTNSNRADSHEVDGVCKDGDPKIAPDFMKLVADETR